MNFIEVKDVVKQYDGHLALDRVSISVPRGCVFGLLGPNGAGKTSLIRILNMITRADSGEVIFDGHTLCASDIANIGYLPEERGLYRKMKVADHILYIARLRGMDSHAARAAMNEWLERFGLTEWAGKKIETLSKGMAQKVQFITTVMHSPRLLIFDEPFSGFDPVNAELLKKEILRLHELKHIIVSPHEIFCKLDLRRNNDSLWGSGIYESPAQQICGGFSFFFGIANRSIAGIRLIYRKNRLHYSDSKRFKFTS